MQRPVTGVIICVTLHFFPELYEIFYALRDCVKRLSLTSTAPKLSIIDLLDSPNTLIQY